MVVPPQSRMECESSPLVEPILSSPPNSIGTALGDLPLPPANALPQLQVSAIDKNPLDFLAAAAQLEGTLPASFQVETGGRVRASSG
jgi:hypothetical protein